MPDYVDLTKTVLHGPPSDHYVLRVVGDSMKSESINDGDYVIVLRRNKPESGELVVARVGDDVTLKRFYLEGDHVRLQSSDCSAKLYPAKDVEVQGVVVGLMRKF
jgi:repressor LexA